MEAGAHVSLSPTQSVGLRGGAWVVDGRRPDGGPCDDTYGLYGIVDVPAATKIAGRPVDVFAQLGTSPRATQDVEHYLGAGARFSPGWAGDDALGLAVGHARLSDPYRAGLPAIGRHETAIELTYRASVGHRLVVEPDLQVVLDPAQAPQRSAAWVVLLRCTWEF